jgi:lipopolysaccharide export system protein LptA
MTVSTAFGLRCVPTWLAAVALLASGPSLAAQGGCQFGAGTRDMQSVEIPGAGRVTYVGSPHFVCSDGVQIWADSAVAYAAQNMSLLLGSVRYRDRTRELRADEARYFSQAARIQAYGHVFVRDTVQGSEIENGDLIYLRKASFREQEQITVTTGPDGVRPRSRLYMKPTPAPETLPGPAPDSAAAGDSARTVPDTTAAAEPPARPTRERPDTVKVPYLVVGDRLFLQGDQYFLASGDVEIERDSLKAHADTAEYDQVAARMLLKGSARVDGGTYTLWGRTINLAIPGGEVSSVRAVRDGILVGEGLRLEAPLVQMFLADGAMERLVATPLPRDPDTPLVTAEDSSDVARPVVEAEQFRLTADSVEVLAPGEVLDRIFAAGAARGESSARDSLNVPSLPELARTDWLEGDTIVATFSKPEPSPDLPADTAADEYRLEQLMARGSAKSLYRMLPSDSTSRPGVDAPAVHYVTGAAIRIVMAEGEVERMEVDGPTRGWQLEPDKRKAAQDTLAKPDTTAPPPDTGSVRSGATVPAPGWAGASRPDDAGEGGTGAGLRAAALPGAAQGPRGRRRGSRR